MPSLPIEVQEELAARLARETGSDDVAFVRQRDEVFFARGRGGVFAAASVLVRGIHDERPRDAHFILRNTVFATREPGPFVLGLVKVAAKRVRVAVPRARGTALPFAFREVREPAAPPLPAASCDARSHEEWLRFASSLAGPPREDAPRHARDRRVGAALVSPAGALLAASANTNGANRTRHAELNVLVARGRLAPGTRLYSTLRPCAMCAGLVWELSEEPGTVQVFFAEDDPGSAARETILHAGSAFRARFARTPAELAAPGCVEVPVS